MAHSIETSIRPLWHDSVQTPGRVAIMPARRARRVLLVAALLTVTLATAAGLSTWFIGRPNVHFVSCWVTNFRDPTIAPNTAANQDRLAIQRGRYFARTDVASIPVHSRYLMQQRLSAVAARDGAQDVVLYVGTYATVDRLGNIVLVTSDFEPGVDGSGLPLKDVLRSLAKSRAPHKLLILDVFALGHCLGVDIASANVAAALANELKTVPDADRLVLCSCSPGQVALQSESLQRTVFGYYFEQALQGAADGYNQKGVRDGRVTVREVAGLLRARVDRWARHNHGKRQIPLLLGAADDFELTAYDVRDHTPPPTVDVKLIKSIKPASTAKASTATGTKNKTEVDKGTKAKGSSGYPKWLLEGWKLRDQWRRDRVDQVAPRVFQILEASLLRIERKWRFGGAEGPLRLECQETIAHLQQLATACGQQLAGPDATSLAMVVASGHTINDKAVPAVSSLVRAMKSVVASKPADRRAILQKQFAVFDKTTKGIANVDIALAVLREAVNGDPLTPDHLHTLALLLDHRRITDQWIELDVLDRLAQCAASQPAGLWSTHDATQLLRMVRNREQLFCRHETTSWMHSTVETTAQACHDAEVYYWNGRYVPKTLVEHALAEADARCTNAVARATVLINAHVVNQQAMRTMPWYATYVSYCGCDATEWHAAVDATVQLTEALKSATDDSPRLRLAAAEDHANQLDARRDSAVSSQQLDALRQASSEVARALHVLRQPFSSSAIQHLIRRCRRDDARPEALNEIDALLATPLLRASDREALWSARSIRAKQWHQQISQSDYQEQITGRRTPALAGYLSDSAIRAETEAANLRQSVSLGLLRFGGITMRQQLAILPSTAPERLSPKQINDLSRLWSVTLRKRIDTADSLARQERLSRIFPPLKPLPLLDDPATNPTVQMMVVQRKRLRSWLAHWYGYETLDGPNAQYYAKLAAQYAKFARGPKAPVLQTDSPECRRGTPSDNANDTFVVSWTISRATINRATTSRSTDKNLKVAVDVLNPAAPWLRVTPDYPTAEKGKSPSSPLRLSVSLAPDATFAAEPPLGFLVRWRIAGRTFHRKITVPALANQCYLNVSLSHDATSPEPAVEQVSLRPNTAPQSYFLWVRNRGSETRTVLVQLNAGATTSKPLKIGAGKSVRVEFTAPPTPPSIASAGKSRNDTTGKLPALDGPLVVTLLDAASGQKLLSKSIPIQLLEPRQYVAVRDVRFRPSGDTKNSLEVTLQQIGSIPGPACHVGLDVSAVAIPGLLGLGDGLLKGTLARDGKPLTLYVRDLRLADSSRDQGQFSISVDGVPNVFVFDTTFARRGDPTTPVEAIQPTLQLIAPDTGRSGAKFNVQIAANYAPANAHINIQVGCQASPGKFVWQRTIQLPTTHCRRFGFSPAGKGGALVFDVAVANWDIPLNTAGLVGHRWLQVSLVSDDQRELAVARHQFVLGNHPPAGVQFVDVPTRTWVGQPLQLKATAQQSVPKVNRVLFFLGKPVNNAIPKGVVTAKAAPVDAHQQIWIARLPFKSAKPGKTSVSVQFTNAAGLSSYATTIVNLTDVEAGGGVIHGTVVEGTIPQHGLQVVLADAQGKEQGKTTTEADGSFRFENLKPGKYQVSASKPASGRHGSTSVSVHDNMTTQATVELWL